MSEENSEELEQAEPIPTSEEILAMIEGKDVEVKGEQGDEEVVEPTEHEPEVTYIDGFDPENPTEAQQEAMAEGWNPQGVEGKRSLSAEEYLDRKPIFERAHKAEKQAKEAMEAVKHMQEMMDARIARERADAVADIKRQMKEAVAVGDEEAAEKLSDELIELNKSPEPETQEQSFAPEFVSFVERNTWYDPSSDDFDLEKANYADSLNTQAQAALAKGRPLEKVYADIEAAVNKKFTQGNPNRQKASPVAPSNPVKQPTGKKAVSLKDLGLSPEDMRVARNMIRMSGMTEEQYVQDYTKAHG